MLDAAGINKLGRAIALCTARRITRVGAGVIATDEGVSDVVFHAEASRDLAATIAFLRDAQRVCLVRTAPGHTQTSAIESDEGKGVSNSLEGHSGRPHGSASERSLDATGRKPAAGADC